MLYSAPFHVLALDAYTCDCVLPRRKNSEHSRESFRGKCPMIVHSFFTATAYRSEVFGLSRTSATLQPSPPILFIYVVVAHAISFEKLFHDSYSLRAFFPTSVVKIFVLKYFRRTSTLRRFFNTKIFTTKISCNEISRFTVFIVQMTHLNFCNSVNTDIRRE